MASDRARLAEQITGGGWLTLEEMAQLTDIRVQSVSAYLRQLRASGLSVARRRRLPKRDIGHSLTFEYQVRTTH